MSNPKNPIMLSGKIEDSFVDSTVSKLTPKRSFGKEELTI